MSESDDRAKGSFSGYGFAFGIPGKYYSGETRHPSGPRIRAWAPVFNFPWDGGPCTISENLSLVAAGAYTEYESEDFKRFLSVEEIDECRSVEYWLDVRQSLRESISVRMRLNSFLLALWLARPTRTYLALRFDETDGERVVARILDRFQWIEGFVADSLSVEDIARVRAMLPSLLDIYTTSRRLRNALVLTFRARVTNDWQSSFICTAAAAEALLTCSQGPGVVHRLADAFARLTASSDRERKDRRDLFKQLYAVRSEIMHGRSHDRRNGEANLKSLGAIHDVVRHLWNVILDSNEIRAALDADDESRLNLLNTL